MTVTDALTQRQSIRAYLDQPVSEATVRSLLNTARRAASGGNLQPWKVIVVTGHDKDQVSLLAQTTLMNNMAGEADEYPIYPANLSDIYKQRRYKVGEDMYKLLGIPREDKPARLQWLARNFRFFGAPVGVFFIIDRSMGHGQWAHLGMFMQSLALLATEHGLATCMQEAWAMVRKSLHAHFNLADEEVIYCGMALGYADDQAAVNALRTERAGVDEFAQFNGFST